MCSHPPIIHDESRVSRPPEQQVAAIRASSPSEIPHSAEPVDSHHYYHTVLPLVNSNRDHHQPAAQVFHSNDMIPPYMLSHNYWPPSQYPADITQSQPPVTSQPLLPPVSTSHSWQAPPSNMQHWPAGGPNWPPTVPISQPTATTNPGAPNYGWPYSLHLGARIPSSFPYQWPTYQYPGPVPFSLPRFSYVPGQQHPFQPPQH